MRRILREVGTTALFVTHDQQEALSLADRVAVMFAGRIAQVAAPPALYQRPATPEVAAFVGEANFLPGSAAGDIVTCALGRLPLYTPMQGAASVLIRPEALRLDSAGPANATIAWREYYGHDQRVGLRLAGGEVLVARSGPAAQLEAGQRVAVGVDSPVMAYAGAQEPV